MESIITINPAFLEESKTYNMVFDGVKKMVKIIEKGVCNGVSFFKAKIGEEFLYQEYSQHTKIEIQCQA